jgi:hypothetical protein
MNSVVHFEIPADNLERAKMFYSIFDWQMQDWPMPDGSVYVGARTCETDETTYMPKVPGAINGGMLLRDKYAVTPSITVAVSSIDEYLQKVESAGGSVVKPKVLIEGMGYYAYIKDTEGNVLGLWENLNS